MKAMADRDADDGDPHRRVPGKAAQEFLDNEYHNVEVTERGFKERMSSFIDYFERVAVRTPVTFFLMTGNEISGSGYDNYLDFYAFTKELKDRYVRFLARRGGDLQPGELDSFIPVEDRIFYAKPRVPRNYLSGVFFSIGWLVILAVSGYFRYLSVLHAVSARAKLSPDNKAIIIDKGECKVWKVKKDRGVGEKLYNLLGGRPPRGETLPLEINNMDLTENRHPRRVDYVYLCHHRNIPGDFTAGAFVYFIALLLKLPRKERRALCRAAVRMAGGEKIWSRRSFSDMDDQMRGEVFSLILPYMQRTVYLLDDIVDQMPVSFMVGLNDIMAQWTQRDSIIISLVTRSVVRPETYKKVDAGPDFTEECNWCDIVSCFKDLEVGEEKEEEGYGI
jgi:hypothetical protein